jgi:hypothetical protein
MTPRRTPRVAATIQLRPGADDDLIRWLQRHPCGQRNGEIKRLLRAAMGLPEPLTPQRQEIQHLQRQLQALQHSLSSPGAPVREAAQDAELRTRLAQLETTVQGLHHRMTQEAPVAAPPLPDTAAGALDAQEQQAREARLRKMTW